jgi:hypothetical protein
MENLSPTDIKSIFLNGLDALVRRARNETGSQHQLFAYSKAASSIRECKTPLTCVADAMKLPGIGPVIGKLLEGFLLDYLSQNPGVGVVIPPRLMFQPCKPLLQYFLGLFDGLASEAIDSTTTCASSSSSSSSFSKSFFSTFWRNGYNNFGVLTHLDDTDLDVVGILKTSFGFRKSVLSTSKDLGLRPSFEILRFLESPGALGKHPLILDVPPVLKKKKVLQPRTTTISSGLVVSSVKHSIACPPVKPRLTRSDGQAKLMIDLSLDD